MRRKKAKMNGDGGLEGPAAQEAAADLQAALTEGQVPAEDRVKGANGRKASRRKQPDLPAMTGDGVARPSIPELDDLAEEYVVARDRRMAAQKPEVELKRRLLAEMKGRGLEVYDYDVDGTARTVRVLHKDESVKVELKESHEQGEFAEVE